MTKYKNNNNKSIDSVFKNNDFNCFILPSARFFYFPFWLGKYTSHYSYDDANFSLYLMWYFRINGLPRVRQFVIMCLFTLKNQIHEKLNLRQQHNNNNTTTTQQQKLQQQLQHTSSIFWQGRRWCNFIDFWWIEDFYDEATRKFQWLSNDKTKPTF